jgi:hypothetical protein
MYGMAELIKFHNGEPALNQEDVNYVIGEIITSLARELIEFWRVLEAEQIKKAKRVKA